MALGFISGDGTNEEEARAHHLPNKLSSLEDEVLLFSTVTSERPTKGGFFGSLRLSPTGGIREVGGLFKLPRYFSAVVFVVLLVLNTNNLLHNDLRNLYEDTALQTNLMVHEQYILRVFNATPEYLIALFELAYLAWHTCLVIVSLFVAKYPELFHPGESAEILMYHRWEALARIFRLELPTLQAFSAMRTLQYVTPGVLTPEVQALMARLQRSPHRPFKKILRLSWFVGIHLIYFFFGAEAFLVKFRITMMVMLATPESPRILIPMFLFLNQMLGIVQLNLYTNQRLFRFIFGGVDNFVDKSEQRRMRVWNASFQKAAWEAFKNTPSRFLAISLTFSDVDFQRMVLDECDD